LIRSALRIALALFYGIAGVLHLLSPEPFLKITPDWVPVPHAVVAFTGYAEIAGAIGLLVPRSWVGWARPAAGIGLALYALCVWPANIYHALYLPDHGVGQLGWAYHGPRLAAQPLIIWLALWVGHVIDWPFGAAKLRP
jgi:uncharacterized membrane protein